jgi:uncharacterized protein YjbJ (UPF0337 family)
MSAIDKMKDIAEDVAGKTREVVGKLTGDEIMIAEGEAEQIDAEAKLAAERAKERAEHENHEHENHEHENHEHEH